MPLIAKLLDALRQRNALRILGISVVDQVLLSAANFFVGVILIRYAGDADYGYYVLAQSAVLLATSAQGAWISSPLSVLVPKKEASEARRMVGAIELWQRRWLLRLAPLVLMGIAAGFAAGWLSGETALVAGAGFLSCWMGLLREFRRSVLQIYGRPQLVLVADVLFVVGLMGMALMAAMGAKPAIFWAVMPLAVGGFLGAALANIFVARDPGWQAGEAGPVLRELSRLGNWAVLASVIYWTFGQGFNYVTAAQLGVTAVAALNAARLLIQPTFVMTMGVKQALLPMASRWLAEHGMVGLLKRLSGVVAVLLAMNLVYFGLAWTFLDWLTNDFLRKTIPDRDALVLLWSTYSVINMVRDMYLTSLLATEQFRILTVLTGFTALVALSVMWPATTLYGLRGPIIGLMVGELFYTVMMFVLIARSLRAAVRPKTGSASVG